MQVIAAGIFLASPIIIGLALIALFSAGKKHKPHTH